MESTALEDSQSRSPTSLETLTHPQCFNYHTSLILLHIFRIRLGFGLLYSSSQQPFPQFSQLRLSCFRLRFSSLSTTIWTTHDRISISTYSVDKLWFLGTFKCSDGKKTQKCSNSSGRTQQVECAVQNAKTRRPKCITPLYMHPKSSSNPRPSRPPFWQKLHNAWIREMLQIGQKVAQMNQDCLPANCWGGAGKASANWFGECEWWVPIEPAESKKPRVERGWMNLHCVCSGWRPSSSHHYLLSMVTNTS